MKQELIDSDEQLRFPVMQQFQAPLLCSVNQQGHVPLQQEPVPLEIKQEMIETHNKEQWDTNTNGDPSRQFI